MINIKVYVKREECIGCGACQMLAPEVFELDDDGISVVINEDVEESLEEKTNEAVEACPTSAIEVEKED